MKVKRGLGLAVVTAVLLAGVGSGGSAAAAVSCAKVQANIARRDQKLEKEKLRAQVQHQGGSQRSRTHDLAEFRRHLAKAEPENRHEMTDCF